MKSALFFALTLAGAALASRAPAQSAAPLTLTTYNIHSAVPNGKTQAQYMPGPRDLRNIADVVTSTGAAIVALQEVRNQWEAPGIIQPESAVMNMPLLIARYLDMNYAYASTIDAKPGFGENREYREWGNGWQFINNGAPYGKYGNAVLSRFAMGEPQTIKLPLGGPDAEHDEPRNAVRVELKDVPGLGTVVVYGTHFQHNNGRTREKQMKHLLEMAGADATTATVFLMGDFNHHPHPGEPKLLDMAKAAGFHDLAARYAAERNERPATTMVNAPVRIDYVFCSKPLRVTKVEVPHTEVSDHLPVAVTVQP